MTPYPRIETLDIDPARFSAMIEEMVSFHGEADVEEEYTYDDDAWEIEEDGQPSEYDEWQDYMGGDDWDHGQFDAGEVW